MTRDLGEVSIPASTQLGLANGFEAGMTMRQMMKWLAAIALLLSAETANATIYTVHPTDSPTTIYNTIQNALCGDTVNINAGTYSVANGNGELIHISGKACTSGTVLLIQASDQTHRPLFDYTGTPLDGGPGECNTTVVPHSYTASDFMRGAWQIVNSQYVTIDGINIKGATACTQSSVAGIRYVTGIDHLTIRRCTLQQNWEGLFGAGTNILGEYNNFISNGNPSEDQEHQWYDSGGDNLTVRYNVFLGNGGVLALDVGTGNDNCCIKIDGTNTGGAGVGGQNLHTRSWDQFIYGNWFQDGQDYEWDMSSPNANFTGTAGETTDMYQKWYGNVVVTNASPKNETKVMTFTGYNVVSGTGGSASITMHLDAQWNTFYIRYNAGTNATCLGDSDTTQCYEFSVFQLNNYTIGSGSLPGTGCTGGFTDCNALGGITLNYANNIMYFVHSTGYRRSLLVLPDTGTTVGNPWTVTGSNNYFGSPDLGGMVNICATPLSVWNGTCSITSSTNNQTSSPPFTNLSSLLLKPNAAGAFGSADTTQTLKSPQAYYTPVELLSLSTYVDKGALQFGVVPAASAPAAPTSLHATVQ